MKWAPRIPLSSSCAQQPLDALLTGELDDRAGKRLAKHLDACETCQQRLTQLAAEPVWWLDASRWLEPDTPDIDPCVDDLGGNDLDEFDASYPSNERDLLDSGLLAKSDNPAMIGSLGRYEVKRVVGAGGTGIVLQAIDTELSRTVAIKVLAPTLAAHGPARKRFARESQAVAAVAHENVVAVHHVEGGGRVPYLVMQFIDGDSLQERIIRDGPLDATTTLRMTAQLAAALAAAHDQGLVHRDVKPANILVGPAGQRVWMTDFGLARAVDDASLTRTGFIAGTPHYMSPEQARGATVRASSDLFGLGGVVYFMLTGRPPFRAERTLAILNRICTEPHRPVREVNPGVPVAVANLVDQLLAKSTEDRFANAEAVRAECLRLLANQASPDNDAQVNNPFQQPVALPARRRHSLYRAIGSAVALTLLVGCIGVIVHLSGKLPVPIVDLPAALADQFADDSIPMAPPSDHGDDSIPMAPPTDHDHYQVEEQAARAVIQFSGEDAAFAPNGDDDAAGEVALRFYEPDSAPQADTWQSDEPLGPLPPAEGGWVDSPASAVTPLPVVDSGFGAQNSASLPLSRDVPPPAVIFDESSLDESTVWQLGCAELEQALLLFESDLANTRFQVPANVQAIDSFDDTIRWMEETAENLGYGAAPSITPHDAAFEDDPPRLPNNASN